MRGRQTPICATLYTLCNLALGMTPGKKEKVARITLAPTGRRSRAVAASAGDVGGQHRADPGKSRWPQSGLWPAASIVAHTRNGDLDDEMPRRIGLLNAG